VIETFDNKLVTVGRGQVVTGNSTVDSTNIIIAKLDLNGSVLWRKDYVFCSEMTGDNMWVNEIKQTSDSGFILTGSSFCKKYIGIKLDKNGCWQANCVVVNNISQNLSSDPRLKISPNPTSGFLVIESLSSEPDEKLMVYLTNCIGQLVRVQSTTINSKIDIGDLPKGIYMLRVAVNSKTIDSRKIILE